MHPSATHPEAAAHPSPQPNVHSPARPHRFPLRFWLLVVLIGAGTGAAAAALKLLLRTVQHLAWSYPSGQFLAAVERTSGPHRLSVLIAAGALVAIGGILLGKRTGGGARAVTDAIWLRSSRLALVPTLGSAVLSVVLVALGASLGREGAPKEAGAVLASRLSDWAGLDLPHRRLLVACGAGAGMAAIYNVPFGGALFAMEVLLGTLALPELVPAMATSLIATAVAWLVFPPRLTYTLHAPTVTVPLILWAAVCGPIAGGVTILYVRSIALAEAFKPRGWWGVITPLVIFPALGGVSLLFPQVLGNGKNVVQANFDGQLGLGLAAALLLLRPLATAACLGSGAPGGLFTPTLTVGAVLGAFLGEVASYVSPAAPVGAYAAIGAGALLAAAMEAPVAAVVLLAELTGGVGQLMVPLLLAVAGATLVVRRFHAPSIYAARVHGDPASRRRSEPGSGGNYDAAVARPTSQAASVPPGDDPVRRRSAGTASPARGDLTD